MWSHYCLVCSISTWNCAAALAFYRVLDLSQQGFGRREWIELSAPCAIFSGEKDGHRIKSWSKNGRDVYKRGTGIACTCFTNAVFDVLYIAYLTSIDVHLLLLETNSTVAVARHIQHFAMYFFKYPLYSKHVYCSDLCRSLPVFCTKGRFWEKLCTLNLELYSARVNTTETYTVILRQWCNMRGIFRSEDGSRVLSKRRVCVISDNGVSTDTHQWYVTNQTC
jgi:hypothetical protein